MIAGLRVTGEAEANVQAGRVRGYGTIPEALSFGIVIKRHTSYSVIGLCTDMTITTEA